MPVILKRLATDFLVLMPLGRRINLIQLQKSADYTWSKKVTQACFLQSQFKDIAYGLLVPSGGGEAVTGAVVSIGAPALS